MWPRLLKVVGLVLAGALLGGLVAWGSDLLYLLITALVVVHPGLLAVALSFAAIGGVSWLLVSRNARMVRLRARLRIRRPDGTPNALAGLIVSCLAIQIGFTTLVWVWTGALGSSSAPLRRFVVESHPNPLWGWLLFFSYVVLLRPFVEESVFRGWLLSELGPFVRPLGSIVLAAGVFALLHGQDWPRPLFLVFPFSLGLLCGLAAYATRSIWIAVAFHGLWNGLVLETEGWWTGFLMDLDWIGKLGITSLFLVVLAAGTWWLAALVFQNGNRMRTIR